MDQYAFGVRALARISRIMEHSCSGLSLSQYRTLATVASGGERASQLAERLALARPSLTAVVDGLVDRGFLSRSAVPGDRRATQIEITVTGRKALKVAEAAMAGRLETLLGRLEDPSVVLEALAAVSSAMDLAVGERLAGAQGSRPAT